MIFSSFTFLCYFLPVVLLGYCVLPGIHLRNLFLLASSLIFYGWNDFKYLIYLFAIIGVTYFFALLIAHKETRHKKLFLGSGIFFILSGLFYFKYANFTLSNFAALFHANWSVPDVVMPIGISFYTFQAISYLVDVYRGGAVQKNFLKLALYISLFPQLVAGPIVRYATIKDQLSKRAYSLEDIYMGFRRFLVGLGKKIIIADTLGLSVDRIFNTSLETLSVGIAWSGILFYTLQIYFDFSGYSDMAIGLGKMFGFTFPENFNYPYVSKSISEFWRRWHMSLSSWFKEYVYIPLGGNRKGIIKTCFNLIIVFLLTGIWHGANWTFILWGIWFGIFIVLEKIVCSYFNTKHYFYSLFSWLYTMLIVVFGWVLFRSDSLSKALNYFKALFGQMNFQQELGISYYIRPGGWLIAGCAFLIALGTNRHFLFTSKPFIRFLNDVTLWGILLFCIILLTSNSYSPFIYFNF